MKINRRYIDYTLSLLCTIISQLRERAAAKYKGRIDAIRGPRKDVRSIDLFRLDIYLRQLVYVASVIKGELRPCNLRYWLIGRTPVSKTNLIKPAKLFHLSQEYTLGLKTWIIYQI